MQRPSTQDIARFLRHLARAKDLHSTLALHSFVVELGAESSSSIRASLIHAYMKCGCVESSSFVFLRHGSGIDRDDVFLWTCLITGFSQLGYGLRALSLCRQMQAEGVLPNSFTFPSVLKSSFPGPLDSGKQVHCCLIEAGYGSDATIANALIDLYAKSRSMELALAVFDGMLHQGKDVVTWTAMISGCIANEDRERAIELFCEMHRQGIDPNNYTYVVILKACAGDLKAAEKIHGEATERGWDSDRFFNSALVDTYIRCGSLRDGEEVFDGMMACEKDLVSSNAMIDGYAQNALSDDAWALFAAMQHAGLLPDQITFASLLKACGSTASLLKGKQIHAQMVESHAEHDAFVGTALIDMYAKCKRMREAREVFDAMLAPRDVVTWNCLLAGYAQKEEEEEEKKEEAGDEEEEEEDHGRIAISLFVQMLHEGIGADAVTYVIVLKACASLEWGKQVHAQLIERRSFDANLFIRSSLVEMYAKCGSIASAREVFDATTERDVVSWNSMISAYAQRGLSKEVYGLFASMQEEGLSPSEVTLACVLSACRHAGLVEDGCKYLETLSSIYAIELTAEHFGCIIDLFARAGRLTKAADFLAALPSSAPRIEPWIALLGACRTHGDIEAGEYAFERIECLAPGHVGAIVLLSNLYADAKRWDAVNSTRFKIRNIYTCPSR